MKETDDFEKRLKRERLLTRLWGIAFAASTALLALSMAYVVFEAMGC